ncbi:MAG: hypothetical protein ACK5II_00425 [Paracoccus sp. (in: a-proteobacteria)]
MRVGLAFALTALVLAVLAGCGRDDTAHLSPERAEPHVLRMFADCTIDNGAVASGPAALKLQEIARELNDPGLLLTGPANNILMEQCQVVPAS